jgi:hypothetical protein
VAAQGIDQNSKTLRSEQAVREDSSATKEVFYEKCFKQSLIGALIFILRQLKLCEFGLAVTLQNRFSSSPFPFGNGAPHSKRKLSLLRLCIVSLRPNSHNLSGRSIIDHLYARMRALAWDAIFSSSHFSNSIACNKPCLR